jgi:hypothetical protein
MIIVLSKENVTEGTMSQEERMTIDERRKYLQRMRVRYWQAKNKTERSRLLDEMEAVTELHRKSLLRLINGELARKPRRKQRGKSYGAQVKIAVQRVAESLDYPCAERLQPRLVWMAKHLEAHGEMEITPEVQQQLGRISVSTLRRMLGPVGQEKKRLAHRKEQPGISNSLRRAVPMRRIAWDEPEPGHIEVDLVHHCGSSADGQYAHTLQLVDVATGWSECTPLLGRSYRAMENAFDCILHRMPFAIKELHPDNGAEFFNAFLMKYWKQHIKGLDLSRSRPFEKNDNRFVEENNFSLVRAYVGYGRMDTVAHIRLLHQLYDQLWLHHNFFQPVMRLQQKTVETDQFRYRRVYDQAQPPLDRLCATGVLSDKKVDELQTLRDATNPCHLLRRIEQLTDQLFYLPLARHDVTEDVFQTLGLWLPSENKVSSQ